MGHGRSVWIVLQMFIAVRWNCFGENLFVMVDECASIAPSSLCMYEVLSKSMTAYLLGLLAMIKCSICSYQCDN